MPETALLPWQLQHWQQCQRRLAANTFPHALLLSGEQGLGKRHFAECLTKSLLCSNPQENGIACGDCQTCHLYSAGTHPDYRLIAQEEDSNQIKVDQVRTLTEFMTLSRQYAHHKIALICDADTMNRNAANSLLKTLEEPPAWALIILITSQPARLPATVRSRCQKLHFSIPGSSQSLQWLQQQATDGQHDIEQLLRLAGGVPLKALDFLQGDKLEIRQDIFKSFTTMLRGETSPVSVAKQWTTHDPGMIINWLVSWVADALRLNFDAQDARLENPDVSEGLNSLAKRVDLTKLFELHADLLQYRRSLGGSLNQTLLMEEILINCKSAMVQI